MKLILHNTIKNTFDEINSPVETNILSLFENSDFGDFPVVSFSSDNSTIIDVEDGDVIHYLKLRHIDIEDILLVSSLFCDGFLKTLKSYYGTLVELIHEN